MGKLSGKVAIVTGATSGMGRAIAEELAREGAAVVVGGRNSQRGREVVDSIRTHSGQAEFVEGDVGLYETNQRLVAGTLDAFGSLTILVANAGTLGLGSVTEVLLESWHETINTNLNAVFYLLRCGIPELQKGGGGSIVINGSIAAYKGFPNHAAYCASKGALVPFVKQVAADYGPQIRTNLICPGPVDTPLLWSSAAAFPDPEGVVQEVAEITPLKRLGTPADIARVALFLASEDSSWMTGSAVTVDGGILSGG